MVADEWSCVVQVSGGLPFWLHGQRLRSLGTSTWTAIQGMLKSLLSRQYISRI